MTINEFISGVTTNISDKIKPNTIPPLTVGNAFIDLANIVTGTTLIPSNGLNIGTGNTIQLGGTITDNPVQLLFTDTYMIFGDRTNFHAGLVIDPSSSLVSSYVQDDSGNVANVNLNNPINIQVGLFSSGSTFKGFNIIDSGIILEDSTNSIGLVYQNNYALNGSIYPRWIPDLEWITGYTASKISGFTSNIFKDGLIQTGNTVKLGGSLIENIIINLSGKSLTFYDTGSTTTINKSGITWNGPDGNSQFLANQTQFNWFASDGNTIFNVDETEAHWYGTDGSSSFAWNQSGFGWNSSNGHTEFDIGDVRLNYAIPGNLFFSIDTGFTYNNVIDSGFNCTNNRLYDFNGINYVKLTDLNNTITGSTINAKILGTIDDSGGTRTSAQLNIAFPNALLGQQVLGTSLLYEKNTVNTWIYMSYTHCS